MIDIRPRTSLLVFGYAVWPDPRPLKLEILPFSKSISSDIFLCELANDHWFWNYGTISKFCTDHIFDICPSLFVSRDYELGTKFRLIVVYLLTKNMEIEVSAFGNFSTDTGSTDCTQININVFRFRRSRPSVPHGANFYTLNRINSKSCGWMFVKFWEGVGLGIRNIWLQVFWNWSGSGSRISFFSTFPSPTDRAFLGIKYNLK